MYHDHNGHARRGAYGGHRESASGHYEDDDALPPEYTDRAPEDFVVCVWYGPGTGRTARDAEARIKKLWGDRVKRRMPHCVQRVAFLIRGPRP